MTRMNIGSRDMLVTCVDYGNDFDMYIPTGAVFQSHEAIKTFIIKSLSNMPTLTPYEIVIQHENQQNIAMFDFPSEDQQQISINGEK